MPRKTRIIFIALYTLFFIGFSVFLLINSFGYRLNPKEQTLDTTATVSLKTAPFGARVVINNKPHSTTPAELRYNDAGELTLNIEKDNYMTEGFGLYYPGDKPSNTVIDKLYLLPAKPSTVFKAPEKTTLITPVSDSLILAKQESDLYIITVSITGITSTDKVTTSATINTEELIFQQVGDNTYWDNKQGVILVRSQGVWKLLPTTTTGFSPASIIANDTQALLLSDKGELWSWNYTTSPDFVSNNIRGIAYQPSPKQTWLWKDDWIQHIEINPNIANQISAKSAQFTHPQLITESTNKFSILPVFQGYAIQFGDKLYYQRDVEKADLRLIAQNIQQFTGKTDSLFWITQDRSLYFNNLRSVSSRLITELTEDTKVLHIEYDEYWNRLMLTTNPGVISIWHDNSVTNSDITKYSTIHWLSDTCYSKISTGIATCTTPQEIRFYINRELIIG